MCHGERDKAYHHRLLATLLPDVEDLTDLDGKHVHHKTEIITDHPDNVESEMTFHLVDAFNTLDNLEVMDPGEHIRHHLEEDS
jgi:hypothetical protein